MGSPHFQGIEKATAGFLPAGLLGLTDVQSAEARAMAARG